MKPITIADAINIFTFQLGLDLVKTTEEIYVRLEKLEGRKIKVSQYIAVPHFKILANHFEQQATLNHVEWDCYKRIKGRMMDNGSVRKSAITENKAKDPYIKTVNVF